MLASYVCIKLGPDKRLIIANIKDNSTAHLGKMILHFEQTICEAGC